MKKEYLSWVAIGLAVIALVVGASSGGGVSSGSVANKVVSSGTIRFGYVVYPPSLIKDANTGELSGIAYDIAEQAAKNLNLKTEWVEEVGWGSMIEGLKTGRYDMIGTLIWPNSPRAREATFSMPVAYSVVYPYVKAGNTSFDADLSKLNSSSVTLATVDGEMTSVIAKNDYPNAKTYALPQLASVSEALLALTTGKADVTFVEPSVAKEFLANNPGTIRQVGSTPVRTFANVFTVARGQGELIDMWNTALGELVFDGTVKRSVDKYDANTSYLPAQYPVGSRW